MMGRNGDSKRLTVFSFQANFLSEDIMPRIKLQPYDSYPFSFTIEVRFTDLNYGGHLGNDRMLALVHEARAAFLASFGFTELDCGGVSLTMGDAALVYKKEAFAGDRLEIEVAAGEPGRSGFRLYYRVTRPSDGNLIALVETGMVSYDYDARKIISLPETVRAICMPAPAPKK
jgi:acyl-CoA thioester hydrolase